MFFNVRIFFKFFAHYWCPTGWDFHLIFAKVGEIFEVLLASIANAYYVLSFDLKFKVTLWIFPKYIMLVLWANNKWRKKRKKKGSEYSFWIQWAQDHNLFRIIWNANTIPNDYLLKLDSKIITEIDGRILLLYIIFNHH